jgi:hypothetical protein
MPFVVSEISGRACSAAVRAMMAGSDRDQPAQLVVGE